jgi:mRNA interferase RelE/StbE
MVRIARTEGFNKAWQKLTEEQKALARKAIWNLRIDMSYPGLRVKKIKGTESIWEARVSLSIRMTFQIVGDTIILRNIGRHDETLGRP